MAHEQTSGMRQQIRQALPTLSSSANRLGEFDNCRGAWRRCQVWLGNIENARLQRSQAYTETMLIEYADSFRQVESLPLNPAQTRAVVNGECSLLVLAGAGSGETSVLITHAGWLLARGEASPEQILLLVSGHRAAEEMDERIRERLYTEDIIAHTFYALALHIIQQGSKKIPIVNKLENNIAAHHELLITGWCEQCSEEKAQMKGWWQWLAEGMQQSVPGGNFWDDEKLQRRPASRLNRWVSLIRIRGGAQAEMITSAPEEIHDLFSKRIRLMAPLLGAWKGALKAENTVGFSGPIHQTIVILKKGRFISPQRHILVDEFQDILPRHAVLLAALRKQNSQTTLSAVGDDRQAIYRFGGTQMSLTTAFHESFGESDRCDLDTTYRPNNHIGEVANRFTQQNPGQLKKPLNSLINGNKKTVMLLDESCLDTLLNKLSGYAKPEERILILARHHHIRPASLEKAVTRWPKLQTSFMTTHANKGQQANYVIIVGLQEGSGDLPAAAWESIVEEALLPPVKDFPDAEKRWLIYVALTRARRRVWAPFNKENPPPFTEILKNLNVPVAGKP